MHVDLKRWSFMFCYRSVGTVVGSPVLFVNKIICTCIAVLWTHRKGQSQKSAWCMYLVKVVHGTQADKQKISEAKIINEMPWDIVACHSNNSCIFQLFLWKRWHRDNWPEVFIEVERAAGTSGSHRVWQQRGPRRELQVSTPALCWKCHH